MTLKFNSKPKRITREGAREMSRKVRKYYKANKDVSDEGLGVYLEEVIEQPNKYRNIVDIERGRTELPSGLWRSLLVRFPSGKDYENSPNKPTQKQLEDLIYVQGNQQLSQLHKNNLNQEFVDKYIHPWTVDGVEHPDVLVQILYVEEGGEEDDIYTGALSDDMFVIFNQWVKSIQEIPEYSDKSLDYISDEGVRNEIHDGVREFKIAEILSEDGNVSVDIVIKVGVNKYGELINLNNYIY